MLHMAGVDSKVTAHSTRAASASAAKTTGASVADILKAGNWCRESTFNRFYNKPNTRSWKLYELSVFTQ